MLLSLTFCSPHKLMPYFTRKVFFSVCFASFWVGAEHIQWLSVRINAVCVDVIFDRRWALPIQPNVSCFRWHASKRKIPLKQTWEVNHLVKTRLKRPHALFSFALPLSIKHIPSNVSSSATPGLRSGWRRAITIPRKKNTRHFKEQT